MLKLFYRMILCLCLGFSGCAVLHHVQIGEIDNTLSPGVLFEIKVSEMGVNLDEGFEIAKSFSTNQKSQEHLQQVQDMIALFQMGPRTGNPIYREGYAEEVVQQVRSQCPSGEITGLIAIRETRKYPVISGEIVKIVGTCVMSRSLN